MLEAVLNDVFSLFSSSLYEKKSVQEKKKYAKREESNYFTKSGRIGTRSQCDQTQPEDNMQIIGHREKNRLGDKPKKNAMFLFNLNTRFFSFTVVMIYCLVGNPDQITETAISRPVSRQTVCLFFLIPCLIVIYEFEFEQTGIHY